MRPSAPPTCVFFPASSSMCARSMGTVKKEPSSSSISTAPSKAMGSSDWEVWKSLARSG